MKLAILVLAHNNPKLLKRILSKLESNDIYFFVHIDKKSDISSFHNELSSIMNLQFLNDRTRHNVNWGGRSQVDAMLSLLRISSNSDICFDRFLFISGADYPTKSPSQLLDFLSSTSEEIVRIDRVLDKSNDKRLVCLNTHDIKILNPRSYKLLYKPVKLLSSLCRLIKIKNINNNIEFVHGSSWFCITNQAVLSIFDYLKKNPEYYEIFKYSFSSDEVFFHTILNNLSFSIYQNHPTPSNLYGLHYIDWSDRVKNPPKILQVEDLDSISNLNNVFFVRKVSPDDVAFLDAIDML